MFNCDLCNKSFSSLRGMYQHYFKAHHLSCKIYYDKFIKNLMKVFVLIQTVIIKRHLLMDS